MAGMAPASWNKPWTLGVLLFGLVMLLLAVIGTFTGKTYGKGGSAVRAKDPSTYWVTLAVPVSVCRLFDLVLGLRADTLIAWVSQGILLPV
jgi:hypothetical protein